jgi:hypothetical protein
MGTLWFLAFLLACSAEVGPSEDSRDKRPAATGEPTALPEQDGGSWRVCDHEEYTLLDGQKVRLPALCNPYADQIWDPPDRVKVPGLQLKSR